MRAERLYRVLLEPHVTEKLTLVGDNANQYGFKVARDATKTEVKHAVEKIFGVSVLKVTTINVKGKVKVRRMFKRVARSKSWKKAYVRLAEGQSIDFTREIE